MIKAQIAAEPEVEDLLASIRKAITDEAGLPPMGTTVSAGGAAISGSMRQSRVKLADEPAGGSKAGEILELRNKISTQLSRKEGEASAPARQVVSPANGFAGILGGSVPMKSASNRVAVPAEPMPLRESLERVELATHPEPGPAFAAAEGHGIHGYDPRPAEGQHDWQQPRYLPPADLRTSRAAYHGEAGMMSQDSAAAASSAFNRLAETLMARATGERPIEDITRELLRTMLKQWLDENLPSLVERLVREEIERVARRGPLR